MTQWAALIRSGGSDTSTAIPKTYELDGDQKTKQPAQGSQEKEAPNPACNKVEVFFGRINPGAMDLAKKGYKHAAQVILPVQYASGTHFSIRLSADSGSGPSGPVAELTDHSRNGTFHNGKLVGTGKTVALGVGDKISLHFKSECKVEYAFQPGAVPAPAPAPAANASASAVEAPEAALSPPNPNPGSGSGSMTVLLGQLSAYEAKLQEMSSAAAASTESITRLEAALRREKDQRVAAEASAAGEAEQRASTEKAVAERTQEVQAQVQEGAELRAAAGAAETAHSAAMGELRTSMDIAEARHAATAQAAEMTAREHEAGLLETNSLLAAESAQGQRLKTQQAEAQAALKAAVAEVAALKAHVAEQQQMLHGTREGLVSGEEERQRENQAARAQAVRLEIATQSLQGTLESKETEIAQLKAALASAFESFGQLMRSGLQRLTEGLQAGFTSIDDSTTQFGETLGGLCAASDRDGNGNGKTEPPHIYNSYTQSGSDEFGAMVARSGSQLSAASSQQQPLSPPTAISTALDVAAINTGSPKKRSRGSVGGDEGAGSQSKQGGMAGTGTGAGETEAEGAGVENQGNSNSNSSEGSPGSQSSQSGLKKPRLLASMSASQ